MKFNNNQYDIAGDYLFPDEEVKTIDHLVSKEEFLDRYIELLEIPTKYRNLYKHIFSTKDKTNEYNLIKNPPEMKLSSARTLLSELTKIKFNGKQVLIKSNKGNWKIPKELTFNQDKEWRITVSIGLK